MLAGKHSALLKVWQQHVNPVEQTEEPRSAKVGDECSRARIDGYPTAHSMRLRHQIGKLASLPLAE